MKYIIEFIRLLFPLRSHLFLEIEYLRAQLAQRDRRIHELQDSLLDLKKPAPRERVEPKPVPPVQPIAPWKMRLPQREKGPDDYEQETAVTVPNAPDAGRKDQADGAGAEANQAGSAAIS